MGLKIVTLNIPDQYLACIEVLVNMGYYPSRSEATRVAVKQFLDREDDMNKSLDPSEFSALKSREWEVLTHQ
jgi:Arc/MetJ-type ribon-helix-helix transcriptional regulator